MSPKIEDSVPMSIEAAHHYADWLVNEEVRGPADLDDAFTRLEQRYGISRHQLQHLRKGKAKTCDLGLFARYNPHCRIGKVRFKRRSRYRSPEAFNLTTDALRRGGAA